MLAELVSKVVSCVEIAGLAIKEISKFEDLDIINKGNLENNEIDLQTEADRVSQCILLYYIKKMYPNLYIIAEEGELVIDKNTINKYDKYFNKNIDNDINVLKKCENSKYQDKYNIEDLIVWIDPLDGTNDFSSGLREHVTILIGIALKTTGEAIAGIIHQPFYKNLQFNNEINGRTIWGIVNVGAFNYYDLSNKKDFGIIVTTSKTHVDSIVLKTMKALNVDKILHTPGAGFKGIIVLEKLVDALIYPGKGTCKWDICAIDAICQSINPSIICTDLLGNKFNYGINAPIKNLNGIIIARESIYNDLLKKIPFETIQYLKNV